MTLYFKILTIEVFEKKNEIKIKNSLSENICKLILRLHLI